MDHAWEGSPKGETGDSPGSPQSCRDCGSQDRSLTASGKTRFPSVPVNAWKSALPWQEMRAWSNLVLQTGKSPAKAGHSSHISSLLPSSSLPSSSCIGPPIALTEVLWHGCHPDIQKSPWKSLDKHSTHGSAVLKGKTGCCWQHRTSGMQLPHLPSNKINQPFLSSQRCYNSYLTRATFPGKPWKSH